MCNLIVVVGGFLLLVVLFVYVDVVGVGVSVSYWDFEFIGEVVDKSGGEVDVENDLDFDNDFNVNVFLYVEYLVFILFNVCLNYILVQ